MSMTGAIENAELAGNGTGETLAPDQRDARDQSIPVRKSDLLEALIARGPLGSTTEQVQFRRLARLLALIYHYEFFDRLEHLHDAYYDLDPDRVPPVPPDPAREEQEYLVLRDALFDVLRGANFVEVSHAEIERAHKERAAMRVETRASLDAFREVRFFRRGQQCETLTVADWYGLRKRTIEATVYKEVVLFCGMKPVAVPDADRSRKARRGGKGKLGRLRPGSVLIKSFRHIASADLNALFPNVRVVMSTLDRLILTVPAIAGGVPIILNLASTLTVLFLVAGFYLGLSGAVNDDDMKKALAAMSGLVALGGFMMRQWVKYQRQSLQYQKELADNIYYRNVNNNAGLFDSLIGAAEEQECKEAFLACHFLLIARSPLTKAQLDRGIEAWLSENFGVDVDFEVDDALAKLDRLGLLRRDGDALAILPMAEILPRLEAAWAEMFKREETAASFLSPFAGRGC
jgi:hypothetical protein